MLTGSTSEHGRRGLQWPGPLSPQLTCDLVCAAPAAPRTCSTRPCTACPAGTLGDYLPELLECAEELLPLLPPQFKNCLMAVARRQGLLNDRWAAGPCGQPVATNPTPQPPLPC